MSAAEQIAYHGPGLTFGELVVGEYFDWPAPIPSGIEPMRKTSAVRYEWSRGFGTAEAFYRVERGIKVERSAGGAAGAPTSDPGAGVARRPADANTNNRRQS